MSTLWGENDRTAAQFRARAYEDAIAQVECLSIALADLHGYWRFEDQALALFRAELNILVAKFLRDAPVRPISVMAEADRLRQPVDLARERLLRGGLERYLAEWTPREAEHA
jgi:hypothetical protein